MKDKLMKRLSAGKPEPKRQIVETDDGPMAATALTRLEGEKARLVSEQLDIAREANERARALIQMAMPEVPKGAILNFDQRTMTYFALTPIDSADEAPQDD